MHLTRLGNVMLAVKDLDKAVEFYHDIIGLPIKNKRKTWVDLGTTGALISLHPAVSTTKHVGSSVDNGITIGFTVGDVTSAVAEMRAKNIPILRDDELNMMLEKTPGNRRSRWLHACIIFRACIQNANKH